MPRTKHIFVVSAIIIGLILVAGLYVFLRNCQCFFNGDVELPALLIQSEIIAPIVEVQKDTTREDTRSSLRVALSGYTAPQENAPISNEETKDTIATALPSDDITEVIETEPSTILVCANDESTTDVKVDTWGLVNTTLREGARIISSLELDTMGVPKHYLQVPMTPTVLPSPHCLKPNGIIGIALDGRVIVTDTPFSFSANTESIGGYALDGFGIFSMYENENIVRSADLDQCHGHTHAIVWNGEPVSLYHYHVTEDSPYTLGCFKGNPVSY